MSNLISEDYPSIKIKNQNRWLSFGTFRNHLKNENLRDFEWEEIGLSEKGNPIFRTQIGKGEIKILVWSQMHGNEATGTLALLEFLSLYRQKPDAFKSWLQKITLVFIPMLNPDGSDLFTRRNALLIDNNRDLLKQAAAETRVIVNQIEQLKPNIAVNLHDQRDIFGAELGKPATISFLAPSFNEKRELNDARKKCMQIIVDLNRVVQENIPGQVGRYSDEFYPAAIGEFVQKKNIPCVLIESGADYKDPNREVARKMNVLCLLQLCASAANQKWLKNTIDEYSEIPENKINFYSIIVKNVALANHCIVDVALLKQQNVENGKWVETYSVEDIGDLQNKFAFEIFHANEHQLDGVLKLNAKANFSLANQSLHFINGFRQ